MLLTYDTGILPGVRMMGRIRYHEPWCHFARTIDEHILYVVRDGDMYLEEDGVEMHLRAGDCLLLEPNLPHRGFRAASCDYYYAHFTHPRLCWAADDAKALADAMETRRQSLLHYNLDVIDPTDPTICLPKRSSAANIDYRTIFHSAVEVYTRREEQYKRFVSTELHRFLMLYAHEYLNSVCAAGTPGRRKSDVAVEGLIRYLNGNYAQDVTSAGIEERFEMNFDYLNRIFARETGSTIFYYINTLRINNAKQLIATTNLSFAEIAYLVGVEDRYYFSRLFKRFTGLTPTAYYQSVHEQPGKEGRP